MNGELAPAIKRAGELIKRGRHVVALTGAGISTPSGIADFRSQSVGLWNRDDPMEVCSLSVFRRTPARFFDWLRPLVKAIWTAEPNPAHFALAELQKKGYLNTVITQNIDGLHQQAGVKDVLEVHGSLVTLTCLYCHGQYPMRDFSSNYIEDGQIPFCPVCNHVLKPDIVLFEEMLPEKTWSNAVDASLQADVFLVAGSSLVVYPAASLPEYALSKRAKLIIVNYSDTPLDREAEVIIHGDVAEILPAIVKAVL